MIVIVCADTHRLEEYLSDSNESWVIGNGGWVLVGISPLWFYYKCVIASKLLVFINTDSNE